MHQYGATVYLIAGAVASAGYFTVPGMRGNGLVFSLIGLSAAAAIVVGALRNRPRQLLPWMLFAAAQVSFVVGDLLYYAFHFQFPSLGDVFYLAVYPLLVVGLLILIRARTPGRDRASLLDASIFTVGLGLLAWVFLIEPYARLSGLALLERVMSMTYPLMDVLLLAVAARLAVGSGTRPTSFYLIGIGIVSLLATDAAYAYIELHSGYPQGGLLDAGWLVYYLLWGAAALLPGMERLEEHSPELRPTLTGSRLVPLAAATLIAPAVGIIQSARDPHAAFPVAAASSAVLFLLVLARMTGLVKTLRESVDEEQRAVSRESVLRRAAVDLGGAPDRAAIEKVTAEAATALTRDTGDGRVRVDIRPASVPAPDGQVPAPSAQPGAPDPAPVAVPIARQGSDHGVVSITDPGDLPSPVRAALEALGAQAAVALERAALADDLLRRKSDERIAAIVQHASDVITVLDRDLTVQHQTASAERFLKYEPGALTGFNLVDLVHPDDVAGAHAFFGALLARDGVRPETEFRLRADDGTWSPVEVIGNNLLHDPRVKGMVVTIRDVSKRKALEDALTRQVRELTELDQIKSDLVATVSHELRTPLTSLVGHVEMLADGDLGELTSEQLWAVGAIDRNSHRLLSLIDDLLTLAKIEKGGLGLALTPTDLPDLIEELKPGILAAAEARSIDVSFGAQGDLGVVLADRSRLERALMNVLSNAVKFTPEGGRVAFDVTCDDAHAIFSVSDTGIGVSAEDKERLFTRFFRSAEATSMAIPGTGLGLTIVKKIVDEHGGAIDVDSSPGVGTTVTLTIPLVPPNGLRGMPVATGG